MSETVGQRVRRLRRELGLTVVDLAASVGASEATIRQLESGNVSAPGFLLGCRLANALFVDPMYLAQGEGASWNERFAHLDKRVRVLEQQNAEQRRRR